MRVRIFFFFVLSIGILSASIGTAQEDRVKHPALSVKWSPIHLIYFYPSFQIAVEHKLFKNVNLQYDFGWILDYPNMDSEDYTDKHGIRLIGEVRYFIPSPPKIPFYVAAEVYYSNINFDRSQVVGYDCGGGNCGYFEYSTYKVENFHKGIGFKYGLLLYPGWNKNRSFFFDINAGAAYREITYTETGKPLGSNVEYFDNDISTPFSPSERDRTQFRLIVGIRLGYRFL